MARPRTFLQLPVAGPSCLSCCWQRIALQQSARDQLRQRAHVVCVMAEPRAHSQQQLTQQARLQARGERGVVVCVGGGAIGRAGAHSYGTWHSYMPADRSFATHAMQCSCLLPHTQLPNTICLFVLVFCSTICFQPALHPTQLCVQACMTHTPCSVGHSA